MAPASLLKYVYLAHFSKPQGMRWLYRQVRRKCPVRIVELGVCPTRTLNLLSVAARYRGERPLEYTGIDLFESRPAGQPRLSLKEAHRALKPLADRVRLLPGDPHMALSLAANSLSGTDLLLIDRRQDAASLQRAWFYVPRMLRPTALVAQQQGSADETAVWQIVEAAEVETRSQKFQRRRAA